MPINLSSLSLTRSLPLFMPIHLHHHPPRSLRYHLHLPHHPPLVPPRSRRFESRQQKVEMGGCKGPITTFIVQPFIPHNEEFYLNIVSDLLGNSISFYECGGIDIEENWDKLRPYLSLLELLLHQKFLLHLLQPFPWRSKQKLRALSKPCLLYFKIWTSLFWR